MDKIVISGGPYSGKTTLLKSLEESFPAFEYVSEPASEVISMVKATSGKDKDLKELYSSPLLFCTLCVKQSIISEQAINTNAMFAFLDRSLIDTIAYSRRDGCEELIPAVRELAKLAVYKAVLFCEPVGEIEGRVEDANAAERTHSLLLSAYEEMNINIIHIPSVPTENRVELIKLALKI